MKFRHYVMGAVFMVLIVGCTSKDTIPPMPPKSETSAEPTVRTYAEMESKLSSIRNPIGGTHISKQKRGLSSEVNKLLNDTKKYKRKVYAFEKSHPSIQKKGHQYKKRKLASKSRAHKIKVKSDETQLKYY